LPEAGDLIAKFLYAITVTVIVVFATFRLGRLMIQAKERARGLLDRLREQTGSLGTGASPPWDVSL
jgi:hypothetical protein